MPTRKSVKRSTRSTSKTTRKTKVKTSSAGLYTTPRGNVAIAVPSFWTLRQTNDDLQMTSPTGDVSLVLNAYERNGSMKLDARDYLARLLESAPKQAGVKRAPATARRAAARYKDIDGNAWHVEFVTNGKVLLLAEISSTTSLAGPEAKAALAVMNTLKIK